MKELKQKDDMDTYIPIIYDRWDTGSKSDNNNVDNVNPKDKKGDVYHEAREIIIENILEDEEETKEDIDDKLPPPSQQPERGHQVK